MFALVRRFGAALAGFCLLVGWPAVDPVASPTAPALALAAADAARGEPGVLVRVAGVFPAADLLQQPYELGLFVRETTKGTRFVCFQLPVGAMAGDSPAVANGLDEESVWKMMEAAVQVHDARLLAVAPGRIEALLPPDFPSGPAEAQLFVIYQGDPIFSNALSFTIGEGGL